MARRPALGVTLPVQRGTQGYFQQGFDILTQTKSNLINLILTKKNERIMQPSFGCDIHDLTLSHMTDDIQANVRGTIEAAVQIWMPFVEIQNVLVEKLAEENKMMVKIQFSLKNFINSSNIISLII